MAFVDTITIRLGLSLSFLVHMSTLSPNIPREVRLLRERPANGIVDV